MTIAVTMGDPAGIGPEIIVKALKRLAPRVEAGELGLLVVGHRSAFEAARAAFGGVPEVPCVEERRDWPAVALLAAGEERAPLPVGQVSAEAGRFAYLAVEK
ncbi:MAG: 4-hydroxythreonine-4-phosphate dehydrogenase PdxA, partial [Acetobacteraceae bacterium]|nr:4-hydroxythreonine-4-phosphate dehydrogenase PdxA [Acetobacteraceae bacterium]